MDSPDQSPAPVGTVRPGGRTSRTRDAVLAAARRILASEGAAGMTMERLARASGVHRTSIYRRWGTLAGVVADLAAQVGEGLDHPETGTLEGDLRALTDQLASWLDGDGRALVRALLAWPDPDVRAHLDAFWSGRRRILAEVLGAHGAAVEAEMVARVLAGALYYQALLEDEQPDAAAVQSAVDAAVALIDARETQGTGPCAP
ncbi:TetR/AcrR family transcriptional regulator [Actinomyces radicidentis]|uniref:TetR/AcrR family transcriptional regulator n=1 Tax=Actinomyces radicidentis TaxID=111015 RepID=UPI0028E75AC6|nr:TetR/AcrR family transcriptional regulator [Actinomyces radicidentis]